MAIVTPRTYEAVTDVSVLAMLTQLRKLELALPAAEMVGLVVVAKMCTQLTHLTFVHDAEEQSMDWACDAHGTHKLVWPALVEVNIMAPAEVRTALGT